VVDQLTNLTSRHKSACGRIEVEKRFANAALLASQEVAPERGAGKIHNLLNCRRSAGGQKIVKKHGDVANRS
jgi:hypothetical protein